CCPPAPRPRLPSPTRRSSDLADRIAAAVADRHGDERHRDALAGRQQHVELARMATPGVLRNLTGECGEVVGGVAHCGDDHDDVVARLLLPGDALRDAQDPLRRPYRCTAVLLY